MKEFLKKLIKDKKDEIEVTRKKMMDSQDVNEVRSLGETIDKFRSELDELEKKLAEAEKEDDTKEEEPAPAAEEGRSFNPLASYSFKKTEARNSNVDSLSTMEYRTAFMNYVQKGEMSNLLKRADSENVSSDLGILLPNTIVNEVIKGVEKVYGQLYSRVKKTNLKGGVQYPIGSFGATLYWQGTAGTDKEHGVSEKQKAGSVNSYVQFTYHIGEIRIAQSLLQTVVSVDAFESEIVKALVEAYVKAMDEVIMNGDGLKQPEGILTEAKKGSGRIPKANIIEFNADEIKDWTKWQTKLFAKIPLSMRSLRPEFVLNAGTYEANIETLKDSNNQPVSREIYNPVNGDESARFKGREVVFVEDDIFKAFDDATAGTDFFGMYWVPEKAYAINTNLQFGYKKYFDEETNQYITKALVIVDGKVLDPKYIYLLKKSSKGSV